MTYLKVPDCKTFFVVNVNGVSLLVLDIRANATRKTIAAAIKSKSKTVRLKIG